MTIITDIAADIRIAEDDLRNQIDAAKRHIKVYTVRKRSGGGYRKITIPPRVLKLVQYWVVRKVLREIPISESATAFRPGSSIRKNASKHQNGIYFVRLDLTDFFPSILAEDFFRAVANIGGSAAELVNQSRADGHLTRCLFFRGRCAIGYPVSPYIANIVMTSIDSQICDRLAEREEDFGATSYTRYADDITISVQSKGFKRDVIKIVEEIINGVDSPRLTLNKAKTKFGSKPGGGAFVTGLRICPDGRLTLHRKYKDHVRLLLSLESKGQLKGSDRLSLIGHLNYCSFADPAFFTRLAMKHVDTIDSLLVRVPGAD